MKFIRELRQLLESEHGDTWQERFRLADDVSGGPITREGNFYYKHKTFQTKDLEVWYFADHKETDAPMDISQLHDDPEVQKELQSKMNVPVQENIHEIETFVVFYDNHSYAMWDDYDGGGLKAMIDWDDKDVTRQYVSRWEDLSQKLDDSNHLTEADVLEYVGLVQEAYE